MRTLICTGKFDKVNGTIITKVHVVGWDHPITQKKRIPQEPKITHLIPAFDREED